MGLIDPELPEVGLPVTTEDPKVRDALAEIVAEINGNLDGVNLATDANVNGTQLLDASIPTAKLEDDAVTAAKLRDDATVDANRAVGTNHIQNAAVTDLKLRDDASVDANRAVTRNHIRDNAINQAKLDDNAVGTAEIQDGAVTHAKMTAPRYYAAQGDLVGATGSAIDFLAITNVAPGTYFAVANTGTSVTDASKYPTNLAPVITSGAGTVTATSLDNPGDYSYRSLVYVGVVVVTTTATVTLRGTPATTSFWGSSMVLFGFG